MRRLTIKGFKTAGFLLKAAASGMGQRERRHDRLRFSLAGYPEMQE